MGIRRKNVGPEERCQILHLLGTGQDVNQVAKSVGRSPSTVFKIRREDSRTIDLEARRPNLRDIPSLKEHRDNLIRVLLELRGIEPFDIHDYGLAVFFSRPTEPSWPIPKGRMWRESTGTLAVKLNGEESQEWLYLQQHLSGDRVWVAIDDCKVKLAADFSAKLGLLEAGINRIEWAPDGNGLGWEVVLDNGPAFVNKATELGQAVSLYYAFRLYDQVLSQRLALPHGRYRREDFMSEAPNTVHLGGNPVVYSPEEAQRGQAIEYFFKIQEELIACPKVLEPTSAHREAEKATNAHLEAMKATEEVNRHLQRLRLAIAFPPGTVCGGCEDWAIWGGTGTPSGN